MLISPSSRSDTDLGPRAKGPIEIPDDALRYLLDIPESVDLVVSLISWGFHYPVEVYADQVRALLRPGGRVILDVRRDTDGKAQLEARFPRVTTISETRKKERLVAEL